MYSDQPSPSVGQREQRNLEAIQSMGDRTEDVIQKLDGFLGRFHGGGPTSSEKVSAAPVPSGYAGQIDRLSGLLVQVENQVRALMDVG